MQTYLKTFFTLDVTQNIEPKIMLPCYPDHAQERDATATGNENKK